ncbi:MAG TPA: NEW3 domain-containing protein [Blastocatellia bacterium]|jgi:hypothetical protein|nr:NEW3 domain-containing protein [Blastocatellia bacterium]
MKSPRTRPLILLVALLLVSTFAEGPLRAQDTEQRRFLEVRRRQLELQAARKQYDRTSKLAASGLVSQTDVDRDRNSVSTAQLNYQQAVLSMLDIQPRISVRAAVKTQMADGRKFVRLRIANLTPTFDDSQYALLNNFEGADPIPQELKTRAVNDIFVSLRDSGATLPEPGVPRGSNAVISLPYEVHIPQLRYAQNKDLNFQLLRDVDSVVVALTYRGQVQEFPVQLEYAAGTSEVLISSSQLSQEADLGTQATFNLMLERPSVDVRSFQLRALNLPRQVTYSFIDPQSQARLSQINFPAGVTRQTLGLRLSLPEQVGDQLKVDEPLEFWAVALEEAAASQLTGENVAWQDELAAAGSGKIKMTLVPRGVGKIEVVAPSLFSEVEAGHSVETSITLRNAGTRRVDNVKVSADHPFNWKVETDPIIVPALEINHEQAVKLRIIPPPDVAAGDYEIRIKTESYADNRRVQTEDKIYRVSVKTKVSLLGAGALIGGLLLLVLGVVAFGIKLTRR